MTFIEEWERFLSNVDSLVQSKPESQFGFSRGDYADIVTPLMRQLNSDDAIGAIESAVGEVDEDTIRILQTELWAFNEGIEEDLDESDQMDSETKSEFVSVRSEQAGTIKDSVESILPLPKWLNRLLKILNEILNTLAI